MAPRKSQQINQLAADAAEFGVGVRCGGWRLGLLVARNVEKVGKGTRSDLRTSAQVDQKVSANQFADMAGVSARTVDYYFNAWELAAKANLVPSAGSIQPGDEEVCVDADAIEVEDDPKTQWSWFYSMAKNPPDEKTQPKPVKKEPKPVTETDNNDSSEDESGDVDEDFGIQTFTKEQAAEADSANQRNELLEILESMRSLQSRLEQSGQPLNENDAILGQISSAALDLNTTANAMMVKESENI